MKFLTLIILLFGLLTVNVCGEEYLSSTYILYQKADYQPTGKCDIGLELVLDHTALKGQMAFLKNLVQGRCMIQIFPEERCYILEKLPEANGMTTYRGQRQTDQGVVTIEVQKYLDDKTANLPPTMHIVVKETPSRGSAVTFYGKETAAPSK